MFARTLAFSAGLFLTTATCQAQQLLNPMTWFTPAYSNSYASGYNNGNCVNGVCPPASYNNAAANNCVNGICPVPNNGYGNYRPTPAPYSAPNRPYSGYSTPVNYGPNGGYGPSYHNGNYRDYDNYGGYNSGFNGSNSAYTPRYAPSSPAPVRPASYPSRNYDRNSPFYP